MAELIDVTIPGQKKSYPLKDVTIIGRASTTDIKFDDLIVSRHHARICRSASGYLIEEIESPFFVEGKLASERAPLFLNGEEVSLLGIDERTGLICYIGMNCGNGTDDMLSLTTLKHFPPEYSEFFPPEKRTFPISPCPEEILKQVPYFALAHQLEIIAAAHR